MLHGNSFPLERRTEPVFRRGMGVSEDSTHYRKKLETKTTFKFLAGLNRDLDDVRGRIFNRRPPPSVREAFANVWQVESQQRVMLGDPSLASAGENMSFLQ